MDQNVLLIVCDTLRKDIMQLYGGEAKTPYINKLAKDSVVYDNAIAPSPWTFPSHVSLFTGLYPSRHGIHETRTVKIEGMADVHKTLKNERIAQHLQSKGYSTIGVSNNLMVSRFTHFDPGFDYFFNIEASPWTRSKIASEALSLGLNVNQVAFELIKKGRFGEVFKFGKEFMRVRSLAETIDYPFNKGAELTNDLLFNTNLTPNFFLFINFYEMHDPYKGSGNKEFQDHFAGVKDISESSLGYLKNQYLLEAEFLDRNIGRLIETLKMRDLYDDTMIIFTADHGQAFNEHGFMYHSIYLYDEIIRIPLVIKYPKGRKFKIREGYQSLVSIPKLIKDVLRGGDDSSLTSDMVFSESFGNENRLPESYKHRLDYVMEKYEKVRKAVYKDGYKLSLNGSDGTIEEFVKGNRKIEAKDHKKVLKDLIEEIDQFRGSESFKLPGGP